MGRDRDSDMTLAYPSGSRYASPTTLFLKEPKFISGVGADWEYELHGVKFDGYDATRNVLLEAKDDYMRFVDPDTGTWYTWFQKGGNIIKEARSHLNAARSIPIEWHVSQREFKDVLEDVFAVNNINGIRVIYTPRR